MDIEGWLFGERDNIGTFEEDRKEGRNWMGTSLSFVFVHLATLCMLAIIIVIKN